MAVLKSYTCSKCAGILIFDSDQEFFDCPFCGTRFSAVDFHGKELLSQADACLKRHEFSAAKEKCKDILAEDPRSFPALRGLLLGTLMVSSVEELSDSSTLKRANLDRIRKELDDARDFSGKKNSEYFNTISQMTEHAEELNQIEKIRDEMESERGQARFEATRKIMDLTEDKFFTPSMIRIFIWFGVMIVLLIAFIISSHGHPSTIALFLATMLLFGPLVLLFAKHGKRSVRQHQELQDKLEKGEIKKNDLDSKIKWHEQAYMDLYHKLTAIEPGDEEDQEPSSSGPRFEYDGSHKLSEKTIQCAKCGAGLKLDMEKRVYECGSCGVAYGISLFFGLPHEKALNSINMGFFTEADKRFSHILMAEPSDFEGLLGRILCAGRWTKVRDICLSDELTPTRLRMAREAVRKAISDSEEQDKAYFECLQECIEALGELAVNRHKQRIINKEMDVVLTTISAYSDFTDMEAATRYKREDILSRLKPYEEAAPGLEQAYDRAHSRILSMARDSVLTK